LKAFCDAFCVSGGHFERSVVVVVVVVVSASVLL